MLELGLDDSVIIYAQRDFSHLMFMSIIVSALKWPLFQVDRAGYAHCEIASGSMCTTPECRGFILIFGEAVEPHLANSVPDDGTAVAFRN
jgi:hypothetical protein